MVISDFDNLWAVEVKVSMENVAGSRVHENRNHTNTITTTTNFHILIIQKKNRTRRGSSQQQTGMAETEWSRNEITFGIRNAKLRNRRIVGISHETEYSNRNVHAIRC